jgi:hypothetical protein
MRNRHLGFTAVALFAVLMTGCGKAGSLGSSYDGLEETTSSALPVGLANIVKTDKVRPNASPAVGVVVDGRFYPKDKAPTVTATPAPAAPESGKGHLHVSVSLANRMSSFIDHLDLVVTAKDATTPAFTHRFTKGELVGSKLSATATNLTPGDYTVELSTKSVKDATIVRSGGEGKVEADKTGETSI